MNVLRIFALGISLSAAACSPNIDDTVEGTPDPLQEGRDGLLVFTHHFGDPGIAVSGQLMAWQATELMDAHHALALPVQAWLLGAALEPDQCHRVEAAIIDPLVRIDLLSAGALTITAPGSSHTPLVIEPVDFPPIRFSLSGVVYDADAPESLPYRAEDTYLLSASGDQIGAFRGELTAPGAVWIKRQYFDQSGLHIEWGGDGPTQIILTQDIAGRSVGLVCTGTDHSMIIDTATLAALSPGSAQLVVAQVNHTAISAEGLDSVDLLFVSRDDTDLTLPSSDFELEEMRP